LFGYYRKFIKEFVTIAASLTTLLKKEAFTWTKVASTAFSSLKTTVTTALVLVLLDFIEPFVVERDASTYGFRAILL
jgi:hypothetical protein